MGLESIAARASPSLDTRAGIAGINQKLTVATG